MRGLLRVHSLLDVSWFVGWSIYVTARERISPPPPPPARLPRRRRFDPRIVH